MSIRKPDLAAVHGTDLFNSEWYLARYPDVAILGMDGAEHYLRIGARLLRDPGPAFHTAYYLSSNNDVVRSGMNPLVHFLRYGRSEGRRCIPPTSSDQRTAAPMEDNRRQRVQGTYREFPGRLPQIEGARTILVCAHVAGKHLFGGERSLLDILDGLQSAGYNAVATTPGIGNLEYLDALRDRCVSVVSFRYRWWRDNNPLDERSIADFARVIADHGVDAVHANTIMLREPLIAARRVGIPAIVHVRELIAHDVALYDLLGQTPEQITAEVLGSADWVVANSEATAQAFPKREATFVIPNTVDAAAFASVQATHDEVVNVGMVSSNLPKKGILDFVAVARLLEDEVPNARFLLIGPQNEHTRALEAQQETGEMPGNIVLAGYRADPVQAMSEIDILLNLSHFQESFGRSVVEAMAAGRAVVVYDWGALGELVVPGITGHVVPYRDVSAVADKVKELCLDRDALRAMGEAGRKRATAVYGKSKYAAHMKDAYEKVFRHADEGSVPRLVLPARDLAAATDAQQPMRIAYFMWHFPVPSETFVLNELRILVAQGHDVLVFCRQSPYKEFKPDFPIEWTRVEDADDLARKLMESGRQIVHSHFTYPTVTEMVWPACETAKVPFTFIAHAQDIFRYRNDEKNRIGEIGRSPWCLRVLVPSRFHRDYVEARGVPAEKLLINPNGIDPELYVGSEDVERATRARRSVCAVHRFTEKKGLEHLIRAGKLLAVEGISIHLYGYGDLEETYRKLIDEDGLDNVFIHGPIKSRDEMLAVFREHDLFACPSVRAADGDMDGIPTVLMEAMASGMPVITTDISGIPDLVQDEITGIVCEATSASIAESVRRFYAMSDTQVRGIIEDAKALIRRDFNATRLTSALLRLWQRRTIDVMIVSWNNLPQLREVIGRLQKFTRLPFHLLVCDNGSAPDVAAFLCDVHAKHDNTSIIFNRENAYVGPGTNICLQHGNSDYAVYVCGKEGFVLDYGWEKSLIDYMDANPDVGLAGTQCYSPSYLTGARYPEAIPLFDKFRNKQFAKDNPERRFSHVQGGFFVIRRAMYDAIGGFSNSVPHSYTDVEYSYYAESEGWKLGTPPRLLALFNKTRPDLFSRIDESIAATHPPMLEDLPLLDRIAGRQAAHCNVCGWHGDAFELRNDLRCCSACGSTPVDRTLYRYLAESMLTYRRLTALGVNVGDAMTDIWKKQFQGQMMSGAELRSRLAQKGALEFRAGSIKVAYLDDVLDGTDSDGPVLKELDRILASDGILLVRQKHAIDVPGLLKGACGLHSLEQVRFSSRVVRYDSAPLYVGRRIEVAQCVS
ncbi:glycosyltransferase [Marilutibacter alkalisoli]|uniref:Glycosyltransferase n=1 Tax=Marilutibacter alkalisoli TaxID=2591633 RepID=A0A514BUN9_9GAMM|nr:glycosyltransferase [Lysobacter alkalisoli]QDH71035.1 glycosyltransferase [Lysobacter alkalisoli]